MLKLKTLGRLVVLSVAAASIVGLTATAPLASASTGALKSSSIKTCSNGVTYGQHGSDSHWHTAVARSNGGYNAGESTPLSGDPCPRSGTSTSNSGSSSSSSSSNSSSNSSSGSSSNTTTEETVELSSDTSLDSVTVNGEAVTVSENMTFTLSDTDISVEALATDAEATVTFENLPETFPDDTNELEVKIIVTAADGTTQTYTLTLQHAQDEVAVTLFLAGDNNDDGYQLSTDTNTTIKLRYGVNSFYPKLILDPDTATLVGFYDENGEEIADGDKLSAGTNSISVVVRDRYGNETTFLLEVKRTGFFTTILSALFFLWIAAAIIQAFIWTRFLKRQFGDNRKARQKFTSSQTVSNLRLGMIFWPRRYRHLWRQPAKNSSGKSENNSKTAQPAKTQPSPLAQPVRHMATAWYVVAFFTALFLLSNLAPVSADDFAGGTPAEALTPVELQAETEAEATETIDETDAATDDAAEDTDATSANSSTSTSDPMAGITIAEAANVSYDRTEYQSGWSVSSGCNLRARILQATSLISVTTSSNGCTVTYGSWYDPYTGATLTGNPYRGDGTDNDLDIDHVIPLSYVNSHGGYAWSASQKKAYGQSLEAYANGVYLAVSASENRRKGDSGPSEYYPPNEAYRCEYATKWRDIARIYQISLSAADYEVVATVLAECGVT